MQPVAEDILQQATAKCSRWTKVLQLTTVIEREDDGYVATCPELDVVSQGDTIEQARTNLLEAVEGFFEVASPSEIKRRQACERDRNCTEVSDV
jgi:predicted RNase H-like HicB family nuclease